MKTRLSRVWGVTLALAALPFVGGCLQDATSAPGTNITTVATNGNTITNNTGSNTVLAAVEVPSNGTNSSTNLPPEVSIDDDPLLDAPVKPVTNLAAAVSAPAVPAVETSAATAEVIKLANSGVDEGVMLAYVTNSANRFGLSADAIVYLNDMGVPPSVVTAMIQRDQISGIGPAVPLAPIVAQAAQTNEAGPNPADVAPQALQGPAPTAQQETMAVAAPAQAVDNNTFYTSLSPYGTWMQVEGYGLVWQPTVTVINSTWRPYFDGGRWVWTDAGWYWYSDYSWGWAPFHYGRWFRHHRIGWCWAPDTVWGPSWVTWRYDSDYCGWAPLPPAACYRPGFGFTYYGHRVGWDFSFGLGVDYYSFVHFRHFHGHHLHRHALDRDHVHRIYSKTRVVTKITGNNKVVINNGFGIGPVSRHTEVRKVALREQPSRETPGRFPSGRPERMASDGKSLSVYRPPVAPLPSPTTTLASAQPGRGGRLSGGTAGGTTPPVVAESRSGSRLVSRDSIAAPKAISEAPAPRAGQSSFADRSSTRMPSGTSVPQVAPQRNESSSQPRMPSTAPTASPNPASGSERSSSRLVQAPAAAPRNAPEAVAPQSSATRTREFPGSRLANRPTTAPAPTPSVSAPAPAQPATAPSSAPSQSSGWGRMPNRSTATYTPPAPTAPAQNYSAPAHAPSPVPSAPTPTYSAPARSVPSYSAPSYSAPRAPAAAPSYSAPAAPAVTPPSRSVPSYSAPSRMPAPAPSFSAPSPAPSRSVPTYSAPSAPAPAPQMSAPAPSRSVPSYSPPASSSRSSDSGHSGGRFGRRD